MGYLTPRTHRYILTPDEPDVDQQDWVLIKKLGWDEEKRVQHAIVNERMRNDVGNRVALPDPVDAGFDLAAPDRAMLRLSVLDWGGPGFEGQPFSYQNLIQCHDIVDDILAEAKAFNRRLTDEEKKQSAPPTSSP